MKCGKMVKLQLVIWSLPVRGAWVEMICKRIGGKSGFVAPRAGSVG